MWDDPAAARADLEAAELQIAAQREASFAERQRFVRRQMRDELIGRLFVVLLAGAVVAAVVYFS